MAAWSAPRAPSLSQPMKRRVFRKMFAATGPAVLPVIHALDETQVARNIIVAVGAGAPGVFLINHDFPPEQLVPILCEMRTRFPQLWLGVNFIGVPGSTAFPILGDLADRGYPMNAYWADDTRLDERIGQQRDAEAISLARRQSGWQGLYFGGTAFKKQRIIQPESYAKAASLACQHVDVVTTSGPATGAAAALSKIQTFRAACGDHPIALASGVSVDNVRTFAPLVDAILIATGINVEGDFYNIDAAKLGIILNDAAATDL